MEQLGFHRTKIRHILHCGFFKIRVFKIKAEAALQPVSGYHTTTAEPQSNSNTQRTRAAQPIK
jgi:hypothetical protein